MNPLRALHRSVADCPADAGHRRICTDGRMPAPSYDATGHTWHHTDSMLFGITKYGLLPSKYTPPDYRSDMPAFIGTLSA